MYINKVNDSGLKNCSCTTHSVISLWVTRQLKLYSLESLLVHTVFRSLSPMPPRPLGSHIGEIPGLCSSTGVAHASIVALGKSSARIPCIQCTTVDREEDNRLREINGQMGGALLRAVLLQNARL